MTRKHEKSKDMENHKKPMDTSLLEEEFGQELGDYQASKIYELLSERNEKKNKGKPKK
ncbi:hypothetical protein [Metabacillus lacus]|uniref:hypothetical protein n=1 Tax=Metabacillus lacus TaxID=1983721 RepID=UPI0014783C7C|nr:hypothetical protein [Metabacillus lacus]